MELKPLKLLLIEGEGGLVSNLSNMSDLSLVKLGLILTHMVDYRKTAIFTSEGLLKNDFFETMVKPFEIFTTGKPKDDVQSYTRIGGIIENIEKFSGEGRDVIVVGGSSFLKETMKFDPQLLLWKISEEVGSLTFESVSETRRSFNMEYYPIISDRDYAMIKTIASDPSKFRRNLEVVDAQEESLVVESSSKDKVFSWASGLNSVTSVGSDGVPVNVFGRIGHINNGGPSLTKWKVEQGLVGERETFENLNYLAACFPHINVFHSLPMLPVQDGEWDLDHVVLIGDNIFYIDSKYWANGSYWWKSPFKIGHKALAGHTRSGKLERDVFLAKSQPAWDSYLGGSLESRSFVALVNKRPQYSIDNNNAPEGFSMKTVSDLCLFLRGVAESTSVSVDLNIQELLREKLF